MRFYSDKLDRFFDTEAACLKAEEDTARKETLARIEQEKLEKQKKAAQEHLTESYKNALEVTNAFGKEVEDFIKKYGAVKLESKAEDFPIFPFHFTDFFKL